MRRLSCRFVAKPCLLWLLVSLAANFALAQLETATVSGQVVDPSGLSVPGAKIKLVDIDRDTTTATASNPSGLYTFPSVRPGRYRMEVTAAGFKVVNVTGLIVNVEDHLEQNFKLAVGSAAESVTVESGAYLLDTESATVSTVIDQNFAENLPLNGRSFQTLIELTPGVVLTASNGLDSGQFSVNGQRADSNYWMVDGVSANFGVGAGSSYASPGGGLSGSLASFSAFGGTNSLVSVDALQEFRIQTSTFAPEFGRTPGGQISITTRSGTNQFHGTIFDYLRNDAVDANNWFNGYTSSPPLPKPKERQNDFGGTFGGPLLPNRTFFFFSYEGLRLLLPQTTLTTVPDVSARQDATAAIQPYLNAFPLPNGPEDLANPGTAQFNSSYATPASLDAYSIRIDDKLTDKLILFARYNRSPSTFAQRGGAALPLSDVTSDSITAETVTTGITWSLNQNVSNDFRFNYSRASASADYYLDQFGSAVPLASLPFPSPFSSQNSGFFFDIFNVLQQGQLSAGNLVRNLQRQFNIVDSLSTQLGPHNLKFGIDFRRLSPVHDPEAYQQYVGFSDMASTETGTLNFSDISSGQSATLLFRNLGAFAQDTWRLAHRLTLTYGFRWDVDFTPSSIGGPSLLAVTSFNLADLSSLALAPNGTPMFKTTYGNIAPRLGVAYQISQNARWSTLLRTGVGLFYDLASSQVGTALSSSYPFGAFNFISGGTFPLDPATAAPPAITAASLSSGTLFATDPNLRLPRTFQWNVALEQALGGKQTISATYVGSAGRRLLQTAFISSPNPSFGFASLVTNAGSSDYDALQIQFQRRLAKGLQALASFTWSHSSDDASAGSYANASNDLVPLKSNSNWGPSDFDIRHALSTAITYNIPAPRFNFLANPILGGWSTQNIILLRSAPPVDIQDGNFYTFENGAVGDIRPDVIVGQPLYLFGSQCLQAQPAGFGVACPGGKGFNPSAFANPPTDPNTGDPLRQGTLGRNALRGFAVTQWDAAIQREFPIHESLKLQFRIEMFNAPNHPNFGAPFNAFPFAGFGLSNQMLGQSLNASNLGNGALSPLYQIGGPRSTQFALKLTF